MPTRRTRRELTARFCETQNKPGMYGDGRGLYLKVAATGSKQWVYRYWARDPGPPRGHRLRDMGLGSFQDYTLIEARERARIAKHQRDIGFDPIATRTAEKAKRAAEAAKALTFRQCAEEYLEQHDRKWKARTGARWSALLRKHVYPRLGTLPVAIIETAHVAEAIDPMWKRIPVQGQRVLGMIEAILDRAISKQLREPFNPAKWERHWENILPHSREVRPVKHHSAIPYQEMPDYFARVQRGRKKTTKTGNDVNRALDFCVQFIILTGARVNEAAQATWDEINWDARAWTVPASRMKMGREHRVALSSAAIAVLKQAQEFKINEFIFPSGLRELGHINGIAVLRAAKQ